MLTRGSSAFRKGAASAIRLVGQVGTSTRPLTPAPPSNALTYNGAIVTYSGAPVTYGVV